MITMGFDAPIVPQGFGSLPAMMLPATKTDAAQGTEPTAESANEPENAFARLAGLVRSNERYLAELKALNVRLAEANAYLESPSANLKLGLIYRGHVQARRARALALLRANRLAAREFLTN
jgi:hypothetical protein